MSDEKIEQPDSIGGEDNEAILDEADFHMRKQTDEISFTAAMENISITDSTAEEQKAEVEASEAEFIGEGEYELIGEGEGEEYKYEGEEYEGVEERMIDEKNKFKKYKRSRFQSFSIANRPRISGDFKVKDDDDETNPFGIDLAAYSSSDEEEEEEELEVEEEEKINRDEYLDEYTKLLEERKALKRKNNYLHKKMAEYLKKKKLDHFLREPVHTDGINLLDKYERKLKMLQKVIDWDLTERERVANELQAMDEKLEATKQELYKRFEAFKKRERDVANGLIDSKTGKVISNKYVEKLIYRQDKKMNEIGKIRLTTIKVRDMLAEKEASLRCVETLGDNLHLVDYEQLRMENQNFGDKIEERDDELERLREKSTFAIQVLAHIREKSYATAMDMSELMGNLRDVENSLADAREQVNLLKIKRDNYRLEATRLRESSGLLTQTKLLMDFENTIEEVERKREQLEKVMKAYENQKDELYNIRKTLETEHHTIEVIMKPKTSQGPKVYRGRPTLEYPELPPRGASSTILKTVFTKSPNDF